MVGQTIKTLSNGISIPQLGLGVYKVPAEEVYDAVLSALNLGYRHIDTASFYGNEEGVGRAIIDSGIPREEIFVTTKVWNDEQGFENTLQAFDRSLKRLQLDVIDLYLIHWPVPDIYHDTWKALEKLYKDGQVRAIGVSNFLDHHLSGLLKTAEIKPMANQIELHPKLMQRSTVDFCRENNIPIESWSPLGRGKYLDDLELLKIAEKYNKSVAQIIIRWHIQQDFIVIPKSVHTARQKENISVFDFELNEQDMNQLNILDEGLRVGSHPDKIKRKLLRD